MVFLVEDGYFRCRRTDIQSDSIAYIAHVLLLTSDCLKIYFPYCAKIRIKSKNAKYAGKYFLIRGFFER